MKAVEVRPWNGAERAAAVLETVAQTAALAEAVRAVGKKAIMAMRLAEAMAVAIGKRWWW